MSRIMQLELYQPITYVKNAPVDPFNVESVDSEMLYQFALPSRTDEASYTKDNYFSNLAASGYELYDGEIHEEITLPKAVYFFSQERKLLTKEVIYNMARDIERFAEAEGRKLADTLYLRYVYEDGSAVTQLFRPIRDEES